MADKLAYHVKDFIENGRDFVVARVKATEGSAPRHEGSLMVLVDGDVFLGTVGGGKVEAEAQKECRKAYEEKWPEAKTVHYSLKEEGEDALGMACGGDSNIEIRFVDAKNPGNVLDLFEETKKRAYIFGAGHVSYALEPVLRHVDFETVIVDDREEYASRERFPQATEVLVEDFVKAFGELPIDENSYIIIVTRGHMGDLDCLREALKTKAAYIGMIGSRKKVPKIFGMLEKEGVPREKIDKVYSPIGMEIFAETPEEISISIAGEMIKVRAGHGER